MCWFDIATRLLLNIAQLEKIDNEFMAKANDDFNISQQDIRTQVASITTRDIQAIDNPAAGVYTQVDIPEAYRIDAKPFIERPFYCDTVEFKTTDEQYSLLTSNVRYLPGDVARSNTSLLNMFKMAALGRPDLVLNLSMAGTISHAGCVLVGVIPPVPAIGGTVYPSGKKQLINTIMSGPHAFLNANEATSVTLHVPWYCNNDMMSLDFEKGDGTYFPAGDLNYYAGNFGTLVLMVLNQLSAATGASTTINIVIEACFKNFDMVIPTPRFLKWSSEARPKPRGIVDSLKSFTTGLFDYTTNGLKTVATDGLDSVRGWLRSWTGLHNPNMAYITERVLNTEHNFLQNTSTPQFFEKMDLNPTYSRVVKEPLFGSTIDEMAISHITAKDQYLGTFSVKTTDAVGELVWIRPISPFSGGVLIADPNDPQGKALQCHNNLDLLHSISRAWRGGLKLKIQSVMNNKQQVKLKVIKYYNPSFNVLNKVPDYATIVNAPSHLLEYTQGGQMHEVSLPYLCRNELTPCHDDPNFEAVFHGVYYIYVAQPLCVADGSPTSVSFNVYISGDDDLAFYGQNIRILQYKKWDLLGPLDTLASTSPRVAAEFAPESGTVAGMEVMNAPQEQPQDMGRDNKVATAQFCNRLLPHIDIRPFVRRMYAITTVEASIAPLGFKNATIDLATLLLERYRDFTAEGDYITPLHLVSAMYYGKTPGFKIRVTYSVEARKEGSLFTTDDLIPQAFYIPPQISHGQQQNQMMFQSSLPVDVVDTISDSPVPLIVSNLLYSADRASFECEIPFTHLMRFVGGPDKFRDFDEGGSSAAKTTANSDLGVFQVSFYNKREDGDIKLALRVYAGVNDETRFGMHSIAPIFYRKPSASLYTTNFSGTTVPPTDALPSTLYRGGYA